MLKSPESIQQIPTFPEYLDFVTQPKYPSVPTSVYRLKDRGDVFGISNNDLARVLNVARPLLVLPFSFYREKYTSRTIQTFLEPEYIPSLAAFIYFGYNQIFVEDDEKVPLKTTLRKIHPVVQATIPNIRSAILKYPDVIAQFPDIEKVLSDPIFPSNPEVRVGLIRRPFNPNLET